MTRLNLYMEQHKGCGTFFMSVFFYPISLYLIYISLWKLIEERDEKVQQIIKLNNQINFWIIKRNFSSNAVDFANFYVDILYTLTFLELYESKNYVKNDTLYINIYQLGVTLMRQFNSYSSCMINFVLKTTHTSRMYYYLRANKFKFLVIIQNLSNVF